MTAREFILSLPGKVKSEALEGHETRFHFDLEGEGGGQFTVSVADQQLEVKESFEGDPKCTVKASAENFMNLIRGELNPMTALFTGKVKISNQGEMLKYAKIFGLL